jgi:ribonuclease R
VRLPIPPPGHLRKESYCIKNIKKTSACWTKLKELFRVTAMVMDLSSRDDGESDIYLPPNEMRAVLHKDRVKVRIVRSDRKGDPRAGWSKSSSAASAHHWPPAAGEWHLAGRARRQALWAGCADSQGATGAAKPGQVVVVELTEPPACMVSPSVASRRCWARSMTLAWRSKSRCASTACRMSFQMPAYALARGLPDKVRPKTKSTALI